MPVPRHGTQRNVRLYIGRGFQRRIEGRAARDAGGSAGRVSAGTALCPFARPPADPGRVGVDNTLSHYEVSFRFSMVVWLYGVGWSDLAVVCRRSLSALWDLMLCAKLFFRTG